MPSRLAWTLLVLLVAALVCASSIWLLPAGQGSFSAVHGPTSHLIARRTAARVFSGIRLMLVAALLTANAFRALKVEFVANSAPPPSDRLSLICILTC
jgi:hypothetical protein